MATADKQRAELSELRKLALRTLELVAKLEGRTVDARTNAEKLAAAQPTVEDYAAIAKLLRKKGLTHGKTTHR